MKSYLIVLTSGFCLSQSFPIDFENDLNWIGFDGGVMTTITNPHEDDNNPSNKVGRMVKSSGRNWAGAYLNTDNAMDFITKNTFSINVFANKNNTRLLLKVENRDNTNINFSVEKTITKLKEWETLYFDFSNIPINTYDRITLIFDNGVMGSGGTNFTYFIDDINLFRDGDPIPECNSNYTGKNPSTSTYELIWNDEFDNDGVLCYKNWTYDLGTGSQGWGNWEAQTYTNRDKNVKVENGNLLITAIKEGNNYTSARIKTQQLFSFTYGKIEVRAKLPKSSGTWPAIWLLGSNNPEVSWPASGEIDIVEQFQDKTINRSTAHWENDGNHAEYGRDAVIGNPEDFNTYTLEWTPNKLITKINGNWAWEMTIDNINAFHKNFFIIINLALGGNKGAGEIDPNFTQDSIELDYIRVYKNNLGAFNLSKSKISEKDIYVFKNPNGWFFSSSSHPIKKINVYDINGSLLNVYTPNKTMFKIQSDRLSKSINFIELFFSNHRQVYKLYK